MFQSKDFSIECLKYNDSDNHYLSSYYNLESVTQSFDNLLCSKKCKCKIKSYASFDSSSLVRNGNATNILNCERKHLSESLNRALRINTTSIGFIDYSIFLEDFVKYMAYIENLYKCSGFCTYNNKTSYNYTYKKYLFSDINNGNPQHNGCLRFINKHNPPYIKMFNLFSLICLALFLINIFLLSLLVYYDIKKLINDSKFKEESITSSTKHSKTPNLFNYTNNKNRSKSLNEVSDSDDETSSISDDNEFDPDEYDENSINRNSRELSNILT